MFRDILDCLCWKLIIMSLGILVGSPLMLALPPDEPVTKVVETPEPRELTVSAVANGFRDSIDRHNKIQIEAKTHVSYFSGDLTQEGQSASYALDLLVRSDMTDDPKFLFVRVWRSDIPGRAVPQNDEPLSTMKFSETNYDEEHFFPRLDQFDSTHGQMDVPPGDWMSHNAIFDGVPPTLQSPCELGDMLQIWQHNWSHALSEDMTDQGMLQDGTFVLNGRPNYKIMREAYSDLENRRDKDKYLSGVHIYYIDSETLLLTRYEIHHIFVELGRSTVIHTNDTWYTYQFSSE